MAGNEPVVRLRGVVKDYRALRPLRIRQLEVQRGQSVAVLGFDQAMAEVLVDLITGATLPDTGEVTILGQATHAIDDADAWLTTLDRFGLLSDRAVLVDQFTAEQNLAMPLALSLEKVPDAVRAQVSQLGSEVGLSTGELIAPAGSLTTAARARIRLGRALALDPQLLLAEHPSASLSPDDSPAFAADLARILRRRRLAALILTADHAFAGTAAEHVLTLQPATGALRPLSGWRRWFA